VLVPQGTQAGNSIMSKPITRKNEARKRRIKKLVKAFKTKYPKQYNAVVEKVKEKRKRLEDDEYASIDQDLDWAELDIRHAVETPEKLHDWMDVALSNPNFLEEKDELRWFMKEYPEFKVAKKL